jgi:hypothetical protein
VLIMHTLRGIKKDILCSKVRRKEWFCLRISSHHSLGQRGNLLLTSNLVSHSLGLDDGDVIDDSLVEVEVLGKS